MSYAARSRVDISYIPKIVVMNGSTCSSKGNNIDLASRIGQGSSIHPRETENIRSNAS